MNVTGASSGLWKRLKKRPKIVIINVVVIISIAIIISSIIIGIESTEIINSVSPSLERNFLYKCSRYCRDFYNTSNIGYAAMFCAERLWPAGTTMGKFGVNNTTSIFTIEKKVIITYEVTNKSCSLRLDSNPVCEDALFCPHLVDCSKYGSAITLNDCRRILCEYYIRRYGDPSIASQEVVEIMKSRAKYPWGSCELPEDKNWWYKYFGDEPCTNPP